MIRKRLISEASLKYIKNKIVLIFQMTIGAIIFLIEKHRNKIAVTFVSLLVKFQSDCPKTPG